MADLQYVKGVDSLIAKLKAKAKAAAEDNGATVITGYEGVQYGIYVHENLEAAHAPGKQAKFLEQPARQFRGAIKDVIFRAYKGGATLRQALLIGGLRLQRESMKIVPVDTGNLRGSAFTRIEK